MKGKAQRRKIQKKDKINLEKIVEEIENLDDYDQLNMDNVIKCIQSDDFLIRCDIVQALVSFIEHDTIFDLIKGLADDSNFLVRCDVCEVLAFVHNEESIALLSKHGRFDKNPTVRSYALTSLAIIVQGIENRPLRLYNDLKQAYLKERAVSPLIAYLAFFYVWDGNLEYISQALRYMDEKDYHFRHALINILHEVNDDSSVRLILAKYKERYPIEQASSVKDALQEKIEEYQNMVDKRMA